MPWPRRGAIVDLDISRIPNWQNILPSYREGGLSADTIRHNGNVVAVPYISNADSLAFNYGEIGEELSSWEALFDSQFRGRAAMQNDFGPTLTNTAIYLKQSGKGSIDNPSDMTEDEVRQTAEFLIDLKKKGHFRTFWDGVQNGADLLSSEEVLGVVMLGSDPDFRSAQERSGHPLRHDEGRPPELEQRRDADTWRQRARNGGCIL